jgi:hypothetical protein
MESPAGNRTSSGRSNSGATHFLCKGVGNIQNSIDGLLLDIALQPTKLGEATAHNPAGYLRCPDQTGNAVDDRHPSLMKRFRHPPGIGGPP